MKISEQWLREWVDVKATREELVEQLTMAGLEVEAVAPVAAPFNTVVIGKISSLKPHPAAERLQICQVHVGQNQPLEIVTGATNVQVGQHVPVALISAVLAGGKEIQVTTLRGVTSQGMLCSATELGMAETAEGILILPEDATVGVDFFEWAKLDDCIIEFKLTPNRGDCLSVMGIAREVAVLNKTKIKMYSADFPVLTQPNKLTVKITAPADCPHYVGRIVRQVNNDQESPFWLRERLRRAGLKSISPVVDIMNYVMLELGQPLHAFDLSKLHGDIEVRRAKPGERLTLLDGQSVELADDVLVIADAQQVHAMAGVMGGLDSAVSANTQDVFLESAFFHPLAIVGRARRYGLQTDAAYRFERGVDPHLQIRAIERATELLRQIVGGKGGELAEVTTQSFPQAITIELRRDKIKRLLGISIPDEEVTRILKSLGMPCQFDGHGWKAKVPSYRFDLKIEADLIEELARVYGYDNIPVHRAMMPLTFAKQPENQGNLSWLRKLLIDKDYREIITYSFIDPKMQALFAPEAVPITLVNPISAELAVMRSNLWPGLITSIIYNQNRQQQRLRFFESGLRFKGSASGTIQEAVLSGAITGNIVPEQWGTPERLVDFFDLKGDVEALLQQTGHRIAFRFEPCQNPVLHPGQSCMVVCNGNVLGYMGAIHPAIQQQLELKHPAYVFELLLSDLLQGAMPEFKAISKFPSIRRDLALVMRQTISAQQIYDKVKAVAGELLQNLQIFDVYQGKGIELGQKSLAIGITLQHSERTLIEDDVNHLLEQVISELKHSYNVMLRE